MTFDTSTHRDAAALPLVPVLQPFEDICVALAKIASIRRLLHDPDRSDRPGRAEARAVQRALGPAGHASRSYSGAFLLVGAGTRRVGVDLEIAHPIPDAEIPRHLLTSDEIDMVRADPASFLRIWTLKEAVAKVRGRGIDEEFAAADVTAAAAAPSGAAHDLGMASVVHVVEHYCGRALFIAVAVT
jgi:4'-phosphopantetheinyl transferase superfamily